ncbi:MAG: 3-coathanger stack domain-containing protein [Bacteroidota bacterium]
MHPFYKLAILLFGIFLTLPVWSQEQSRRDLYRAAVQAQVDAGTYQGFKCADDFFKPRLDLISKDNSCPETFAGYGTAGWNPNSSPSTNNADPSCTVPFNTRPCNGGKIRIPIRNIIFECPNWNGTNYIGGSGFEPLPDVDIDATYASVNDYFANANVELVEIERQRVTNCDMYDFYWNGFTPQEINDQFNDGVKDETQLPGFDTQDVIDVYWVGGFNANHDCCSFFLARLDKPPSTRDYAIFRYVGAVNPSLAHHELSHYFGVYHTFWNIQTDGNEVSGQPHTALNNSNCLTTGDGVCDTWPDAHFEYRCAKECRGGGHIHCYKTNTCAFDHAAYQCVNGNNLQIDPAAGTVIDTYTSTVMQNNITTYNHFGCRNSFTPCQYYKLNTVAKSCRNNLCFSDPNVYFNSPSDYQKTINPDDSIPVFTAGKMYTSFDGSSYVVDCFDWFLNEGDLWSEAVVTGASTFDPSPYVSGPGVYTFYLSEANALNDPPCKIPVQLTITNQNCNNCATCEDGIRNGDETGIDCGGSTCPPCNADPTCDDDIQNGDETGVDCGGTDCPACPPEPTCDVPTRLRVYDNNGSTAILSWTPVANANSYTVKVEQMSNGQIATANTTDTFIVASPLIADLSYEWRVKSNCDSEESNYSEVMTFVAGAPLICIDTLVSQLSNDTLIFSNLASITSNVQIGNDTVVTFVAADYILLQPGFQALAGSQFQAGIEECSQGLVEEPIVESRTLTTQLEVFPNPADQLLNVVIEQDQAAWIQVDLYGLDGRKIRLLDTQIENGRQQFEFSTAHLPNGLYVLRVNSGDLFWNEKVLIQH